MDSSNLGLSAKFKFTNGELEISGSETFVSNQIQEFKPLLYEMLSSYLRSVEAGGSKALLPPKSRNVPSNGDVAKVKPPDGDKEYAEFEEIKIQEFENVFAVDGDKIQIITDIPGASLAKRMINLVVIYLWIKLHLGQDEVAFSELREACEKHGELDKPNFAKQMHLNKRFFIINGTGRVLTAKLIRPGVKEAERLIEELNHSDN